MKERGGVYACDIRTLLRNSSMFSSLESEKRVFDMRWTQ